MTRVKKIMCLVVVLSQFFAFGFLFPCSAEAANFNFSQSILPVRFVYLGENNEIEKIWSNISERDDVYAIKFFDYNLREMDFNEDFLYSFQKTLEQEKTVSASMSIATNFIKSDSVLEEVRTYC